MSAVEPSLVEEVIALDDALSASDIAHAFGGALALAYYTRAPRATADIDVNVSVEAADAARLFDALPDGVNWSDRDLARVRSDEQVRLWWGRTPVDIAAMYDASAFGLGAVVDTLRALVGDDSRVDRMLSLRAER